jgi:TRAP transporter TAXI family solute receptor
MRWRSAPRSKFTVKTGSAYREGIELVASGEADLAITTPSHMGVRWAYEGRHFYAARPLTQLRTLGRLPQDDRLTFAVRADTGLRSFADIRERKPALQIATPLRDENNLCSYVIDLVLRAHGIEPADMLRWGGSFLDHDSPRVCLQAAIDGQVNAVFNEAIMLTLWSDWARRVPIQFIPIEPAAMQRLVSDYGLRAATVEPGRVLNEHAVPCLDWSHWATVVRDDMPEDVAYEITSVMVEERAELEARFRHIPAQHSPLSYPIDPRAMTRDIGLPLHPGALRYYREHGPE